MTRRVHDLLVAAAELYLTEAQKFCDQLNHDSPTNSFYVYPEFIGCCDALAAICDALTHDEQVFDIEATAFYILNLMRPMHLMQDNPFWWEGYDPGDPDAWIQDIETRVLAICFAAAIADDLPD